jgi:SAM-dependent methyltransferase
VKLIGGSDEDRAWVSGLRGVFPDPSRQARYISDGWERMQVVLRVLKRLKAAGTRDVLELGSNPYILTLLMQRHFDFKLTLANYFGEGATQIGRVDSAELEGQRLTFRYDHFNIELDSFPYGDQSFDCVLFCEIIEHLLISPEHALAEIARTLRPGGFVVISTPNATRFTNLYFLAMGRNIYEGYSANGPYGRHNREFTLDEVVDLLDRRAFDIFESDVRNIQALARRYTWIQWMRPTVWYEHLFVVGRKR